MLTINEKQKRDWLDEYSCVVTLYQVFNEGRESLRTKRATYRCDEVEGIPLDFIIDVELKSSRALPAPLYEMFLRLSAVGQPELLPDAAKLLLGKVWEEYSLGVEGSYRTLYFRTKNEQVRNFLKGRNGNSTGIEMFGPITDQPDTANGSNL
jgi:hypothetical protein